MPDYTAQFSDFSNMPQYDLARKRAAQQVATDKQANLDALQRRFANLGNLNSGAQLKQEENLSNDAAKALADTNEGINAQQEAEILRRKEVLQGQQFQGEQLRNQQAFQTAERLGGQEFAGGQAGLQRQFQTGERIAGQEFASGEAGKQREFMGEQNQANRDLSNNQFVLGFNEERVQNAIKNKQFQQSFSQAQEQFNKSYILSNKQLEQAQDQFDRTYAEELRVDTANMGFARDALAKQGFLETVASNFSIDSIKKDLNNLNPAHWGK